MKLKTTRRSRHEPQILPPDPDRRMIAFLVDLVIHAAGAAIGFGAVYLAMADAESASSVPINTLWGALGGWIVASFVHRCIYQAVYQQTVGKRITSLRVVHPRTGSRVGFWYLVRSWVVGVVVLPIDGWTGDGQVGMPAVTPRRI
ncbi:RDD family protein [Rhodococcus sp. HNM0569]|uniref:RDD family protein n=1 Tax=Rhodococcus sp. HNM0569 TaxID=2716340 RepID=UPI00146A667A|nr:RDD family protein [Rhodococcus sp. HNM0569]NLU83622.1 RDD family protein [Rhodococcus sp. HNM0569]